MSRGSKMDRAVYSYFQNSVSLFFDNVYGEVLDLEFAILEKRLCPR